MMKKFISKVSPNERDHLKCLLERKSGITELLKIINIEDGELYERVIRDLSNTNSQIDNWWVRMSNKYQWEYHENGQWEINFDECSIFLNNEI